MSRAPEIIVVDDSSEDASSSSEEELRVAVASMSRKNGKAPTKKHKSAVFGDYVLTREERYLLGADDDDESESSADDDEYDDRDDSFGDGARAFARKRRRATASGSTPTTKRRKPPSPTSRLANPKPPPSRLTVARRYEPSESEQEEEEEDEEEDLSPRHTSMVRNIAKAHAMRSQLNGKAQASEAVRRPVHNGREHRRVRDKEMTEKAKKKAPTPNLKKPLAARKSAAPVNHKVMRPSKRPSEEDSDDYEDDESSQNEEEEEPEEEEEESDGSESPQRRPTARNKAMEEIEIPDGDSASSDDSDEELGSDSVLSRRHSPPRTEKVGGGITTHVSPQPAPKKKPLPKTSVPKTKPRPKTPPLPPPRRPSPPQAPPAIPRPRTNEPAARSSRAVASLPENMSIEDMQAQERQLAYFKQLQKRKEQSSQQAASSASRTRPAPNTNTARSAAAANHARKPVTTQSVYRLSRQDSAASINSSAASSVASREPKPLARSTKVPPPFLPPALREAYSTAGTRTVVTTVSVALDAATSFAAAEKVNHIPLSHNSWWRERLQFVRAPLNILPAEPHSYSWQAFSKVKERELGEFDESRTIAPLADLASPPTVSTNELLAQSFESQENINQKVRRVIDKSLPVLKQCHRRRVQDIISEMRKSLPWAAPRSRGGRSLQPGAEGSPGSEMASIEHVQAKRILLASLPRAKTQQLNRLVGTIHYVLGYPRTRRTTTDADESLEDAVYELPHFPETIIEFGEELAPMRRACTWISVKTNVHVDDDPILRYIPYLGDKERVNIDPRRYNATTLDKERSIIVELPESDERQAGGGEEVVKTQERLDMWRSDVANLAYATRSATDDEVMEYLLCMVIKQCGRSDKVIQALREVGGFAEPITDYDVIQKREAMAHAIGKRLHDLRRCLDTESNEFTPVREFVSRLVRTSNVQADNESVDEKLRAPLGSFSSNYLEHPEAKGVRPRKSMGHMMEWYRDLFCRRCYTYDCPHGIQFPQPSRRTDPLNPVVKKSGVGLTRAKKASGNGEDDVIEIASSSSSEDSDVEEENEDVQSTVSGSVDGEADTTDGDGAERRRSGRSGTRASSMATASLKVQEVMVEKERRKLQRKQAKQLQKLVRQVDDSEYLDDSYRDIVGPVMDTLLSPEPASLCGACCWKRSLGSSHETSPPDLSEVSKLMLRKLLPILGDNACISARLLQDPASRQGRDYVDSCAAIHRYIDEQKQKTGDTNHPSASSAHDGDHFHDKTGHRKQHQQNRSSAALHSGNRELIKRTRMNRAQQQTKEHEHRYEPCNHSGACDARNCDCLKRGHDCDNACSCSRECVNRHHGCKCAPGQCRKKGCLCYDASRECDPDFCFLCGAHEAAVMVFDETQRFVSARNVGICQNVSLLRGVHKKIGVAFSATHGWGAYALEPIHKGEFVYEYTGALISDDEAERRGNIYDALNVSFLFNVNSDEVVDAMRKGNKIKFANHKTRELANLDTKILVVRGEHRIALFAKWDLPLGEELFFDYGYTNETAPEWSQLRTPHNSRYTASDPDDDDDGDELEEVLRLQS